MTNIHSFIATAGFVEKHTGGGCLAFVLAGEPDLRQIVITDQDGTAMPEPGDWIIGVYPNDEWQPEQGATWESGQGHDFEESMALARHAHSSVLPLCAFRPIRNLETGKRWIEDITAAKMLWHFDDDLSTIIWGEGIQLSVMDECILAKARDDLYDLDWGYYECPIGYALSANIEPILRKYSFQPDDQGRRSRDFANGSKILIVDRQGDRPDDNSWSIGIMQKDRASIHYLDDDGGMDFDDAVANAIVAAESAAVPVPEPRQAAIQRLGDLRALELAGPDLLINLQRLFMFSCTSQRSETAYNSALRETAKLLEAHRDSVPLWLNTFADMTEFPEYPWGWEDTSYRNDACPSIANRDLQCAIFIDYPNKADRESGSEYRFTLLGIGADDSYEDEPILHSNDFDEVMKAASARSVSAATAA